MGNGERWSERLQRVRKWAEEKMRPYPLKVEPKHRVSGPRLVPSDWMDPDKQRFMGPQCKLCHTNTPVGSLLHGGLCGTCWMARIEARRHAAKGPPDLPPAA